MTTGLLFDVGSLLMRFAGAKASFESISSIYVYSLQPTVLQDLNVLTDVSREMLANHAQEDPLEYGKQWGMIQNTNVKVWTSQDLSHNTRRSHVPLT